MTAMAVAGLRVATGTGDDVGGRDREPRQRVRGDADRSGDATRLMQAYTAELRAMPLLPEDPQDRDLLLNAYIVERAMYEIGFELSRGSAWVRAPLLDLPLLL